MTSNRRIRALDPRLLIGVGLVAASVAGVITIVSAADETIEVLAAAGPLAPGDRVDADDLVVARVRLDAAARRYLAPEDLPASGVVVSRAIGEGELVPASAVGSVEGVRLASLVLEVNGALAASVQSGATVDLWAAREIESGEFAAPSVIVPGAIVVRLVSPDTIVGVGQATAVEVLVPKSRIARVLEAVANADELSIVPTSVPQR
jgi:hypothetical protein